MTPTLHSFASEKQAVKIPGGAAESQSDGGRSRATPWDYFDRVYCITLAGRTDRRRRAEAEFAAVGLAGKVEFRIFQKHPTDAEEGIFESHMQCLRAGLEGGDKILIFEDDVTFHRFSLKAMEDAVRFMQSDRDWRIFFLGCFVDSSRRSSFPSVIQIKFRCLAHAYVVNREFAELLVEQRWSGVAYDDLLRKIVGRGRAYALYPAIASQSGSPTDNGKTVGIDRIRRLLGGVRRLQRWNEFSTLYLKELIAAHVILVGILIAVAFLVRRFIVEDQ
jgi:GR25 family glycosyltransferase involved in LPS biosynthesis